MTDIQIDALRILRVCGPVSNQELSRRLHEPPCKTYRALQELIRRGLATHPELREWDISELGRDYFASLPGRMIGLFP